MQNLIRYLFILLSLSSLIIFACGNDSSDSNTSTSLSGQWRYEKNNILYSIVDNGFSVEMKGCDIEPAWTFTKSAGYLLFHNHELYRINSETELEVVGDQSEIGNLNGTIYTKISSNSIFDNGHVMFEGGNIEDIDVDSGVCAYRESDNSYIEIVFPYGDELMRLSLYIDDENALGDYSLGGIPHDVDLYFKFYETPDTISTISPSLSPGTITISEYSDSNIIANFDFQSEGENYSGAVDITF